MHDSNQTRWSLPKSLPSRTGQELCKKPVGDLTVVSPDYKTLAFLSVNTGATPGIWPGLGTLESLGNRHLQPGEDSSVNNAVRPMTLPDCRRKE